MRDEFGPEPVEGEPAGKPGSDEAGTRYGVGAAREVDAADAGGGFAAVCYRGFSGAVPPSRPAEPEGSAFAPPSGVVLPGPAASGAPTSDFTPPTEGTPGAARGRVPLSPRPPAEPDGSAFAPPPGGPPGGGARGRASLPNAFTPPSGVPRLNVSHQSPWPDRMRALLRMSVAERPAPEPPVADIAEQKPETAPAVPRVLDLTLRIGELLLAGGEGAEDVEAAMLGVTHAYGLARVEPNVTFTLLGISYQPSLTEPPVSVNRTVRRRAADYTRLAAVFRLVEDITGSGVSLEDAYGRLAEIRRNRHPYPGSLLTAATGILAGSAAVLVGGGRFGFVAGAIGAVLGDRLAWLCAGRGLPEFYQFAAAAMPAALMGVVYDLFGGGLPGASDLRASAIITGGLFALMPGRALVAAVQDGLTGFYITASARLLEVLYLVVGIVLGVTLVLYPAVGLGATLDPDQQRHGYESPLVQLSAAMVVTLAFAIMLQVERYTLPLVTLNGGVAWVSYGVLVQARVSPVVATAVAAGLVGLFGQLLSRYRYVSALPYVTAAIGPLLPGAATYFGLLGLTRHHLAQGFASLSTAAALALAIAVGVNFGNEIARLVLPVPGMATGPSGRRAAKRTRGF